MQSINVIDANAGDGAIAHHLEEPLMDRRKDLWILDPNCGQLIHIEKPPIIDFLGSDSPVAKSIGLRAQQLVQVVERSRMADSAFEVIESSFDRVTDLRELGTKPSDPPLNNCLFSGATTPFVLVPVP